MRRPARRIRQLAVLAMALLAGNAGASDLFLFRGEFIYIIPRALSDEMTRLAGRGEWKQFPQHTRFLDLDTDGADDFVAVAFGATSGHGAQVRYRLRHTPGGGVRLGRWYWGVLVDPDGRKLFERFNP
jgi:hypothetical protein